MIAAAFRLAGKLDCDNVVSSSKDDPTLAAIDSVSLIRFARSNYAARITRYDFCIEAAELLNVQINLLLSHKMNE